MKERLSFVLNNILKITNVSKCYDNKIILNHINLSFNQGDYLVVCGSVGSGKSTIFNLITKRELTEGTISLYGIDINEYSKKSLELLDTKLAFMPSNIYFDDSLNVMQNMELICHHKVISPSEALLLVDASGINYKNMMSLNGLERIKVYLAGLLMSKPEALILDEPTGSLDSERSKVIYDILDKIHQMGVSIMVLTKKTDNLKKSYIIKTINNGRLI